jgi:O-antigen/teichoic acid export membrane protein
VWNLFGQLLPIATGLISVPLLVRFLGVERFGLLTLIWIVVGYFSLFDLGLGRALTKLVADKIGTAQEGSISSLVWTTLALMLALGILGGVATFLASPWLVFRALKVPAALQGEALWSFYLLSLSIPVVTASSGLRGFLEALQRFRVANLIKIPASMFLFVCPLFVLPFSHSLVPVTIIMVVGRAAAGIAYLMACLNAFPALRHQATFDRSMVLPVMRFGMWMTVSNILSPLMVYVDRFVIGALLSLGAVAYYTAPFDAVNRLLVIPAAVAGVLFPAFAITSPGVDDRAVLLLGRALKYVFLAMFPCILCLITLAPDILRVWLGPAFATHGTAILRILAAGIFVNALAHLPFALIQGRGRPDLTAKLHIVELPLYLLGLWFLTGRMGIEGTAFAWTGRICMDALVLFSLVRHLMPISTRLLVRLAVAVTATLALFYVVSLPQGLAYRLGILCAVLVVFAFLAWSRGLDSRERIFFREAAATAWARFPVAL